jgi:hypothetical protein
MLLFGKDDINRLRNSCLRDMSFPYSSSAAFLPYSWLGGSFENRYCTAQLMKGSCFFAMRKGSQLFYSEISYYGFSKMGETNVMAGYHRLYFGKFSIGLNLSYLMEYAENEQAIHSLFPSLSLTALIKQNFFLLVFVENPVCMKYGLTGKQLFPIQFALRLNYFFKERVAIWADFRMKIPAAFDFHIGTDIYLKPIVLDLCLGRRELTISCKLPVKSFVIDIISQYDFLLGYSPKLSIYYHF